jgi:hypothetical protein
MLPCGTPQLLKSWVLSSFKRILEAKEGHFAPFSCLL